MRAIALLLAVGAMTLGALGAPTAALAAPAETQVPDIEIDRIEITGVTAFGQADIEDLLEISPGDRLERIKVVRTAENIEEFYRSRGYERASVRTRLSRQKTDRATLESVLDFVVTEGKPTRVALIRFTPDSIRNEAFRKYWRSIEADLVAKSGMLPGDIFDQEKISVGKRAVQDLLASEEFVGARVDDVRVADSDPPVLAAIAKTKEAGRWVTLDFHIDLGDRVVFGFKGSTIFTQGRLSSLVAEQRVVGFGRDYVGAIRQRIEDVYRAEGYADVVITPYTVERPARQERHVTYSIVEGKRVTLDEITFEGNSVFSSERLRERFYKLASTLIQHGYYVEKDVQKAVDLTAEWMKANGYLAAKVVTVTALQVPRPKRAGQRSSAMRVIVYLYEGDQTIVQSVELDGLNVFTPSEIKSRLGLREGQPLNLFAFNEGLESLKFAYRAKGYLAVRIANEGTDRVVHYTDENRLADIRLELVEGYQFKVSAIEIEGLTKTKEIVVRRELAFKEGDVLAEGLLTETEAALRRLGIFSTVALHLHDDPARPETKRVVVSLQEGTPGVLAGGPGLRNDLGARLFGQLAYTNLWGLNHTLSLTSNVNRRFDNFHFVEYQAQLAYLYPWFLGYDVTFRPSFTATGTQYIKFDATVYEASATWEKKFLASPALTGLFTYSLERVHQFNAAVPTDASIANDNQGLRIGAITPGLRLDTRDSPLSPTTGWYATTSVEYSSWWLGSQGDSFPISYVRAQGRVDRFISLGSGITWFLSFRAGYEISREAPVTDINGKEIANSGAIPLIKQFALGGAASLRGYTVQELNAQTENIRGSLSYVNYRTQLDFPFADALKVGPFLDVANLLIDNTSVGQFFFDQLQFGAGFGMHYQTPVGSVNLDIGFKLSPPARNTHPQPGDSGINFHFSIGVI